jgi:cell division protein ZapD
MINYEFPINEKFRKYLKIEYLFKQYDFFIKQKHNQYISNVIFQLIFKLNVNAARADIKVELINDLQKIQTKYKKLSDDANKLKKRLEKNNSFTPYSSSGNKMIQELKVRSESPTYINDIDFSKYKLWNETQDTRTKNLFFRGLTGHINPIKDSIYFILSVLRKDSHKENLTAINAVAQLKLNPSNRFDLLTIHLRDTSLYEPTISANKYAININLSKLDEEKSTRKTIKFSASLHSL